ncbi:MAG: hypothetical protein ACP5SH_25695, partial [Syntrophobacteraceae bacterium]
GQESFPCMRGIHDLSCERTRKIKVCGVDLNDYLKTNDSPPKILASQLFFLFDVEPTVDGITDDMTLQNVVVAVGNILQSKQRLQEDVHAWANELFEAAGLPFEIDSTSADIDETATPPSGLSVVPSQPATPKPVSPTSPKRKSRRIYLDMAIRLLEVGACTHAQLVEAIMGQYPTLNRETVSTFAFDIQNPKYSPIKDRKVIKRADETLIFEDCVRPALTVIENPNFAGTETEQAAVAIVSEQASSS